MPNDGVPIYMRMDSVKVLDSANHPESQNITDVWVEANADNTGAYELPCNFPVLQENDVRFVVSAGIKESGQSGVRVIYPFYTTDTFTIVATRGVKYSHAPVFKYVEAAQFSFDQNFDNGNNFGPTSNLSLVTFPDPNIDSAFGGFRCLKITAVADSSMEIRCNNSYDLPEGQEIWLEVSYKCEVPFFVGFYGNFNTGEVTKVPVVLITQKPSWNKVYVKMSNFIGNLAADTYTIYFEALRPYGSSGGSVYIDNVKLVHF